MKFIKVAIWFFATATSFLLCISLLLGGLFSKASHGPPAPLTGAIDGIAMLVWFLSAAIFIALLIFRPRTEISIKRVTIAGLLYFTFGGAAYITAVQSTKSHTQKLSLTLIDTEGHPIKSAIVSYEHSLRGDGFRFLSPAKKGTITTDDNGKAVIDTNSTHEISIEVTQPDFTPVTISFDRDWGFSRQDGGISWLNPEKDISKGIGATTKDYRGYRGYIPSQPDVSLTFCIPRRSLDEVTRIPFGDWTVFKAE